MEPGTEPGTEPGAEREMEPETGTLNTHKAQVAPAGGGGPWASWERGPPARVDNGGLRPLAGWEPALRGSCALENPALPQSPWSQPEPCVQSGMGKATEPAQGRTATHAAARD